MNKEETREKAFREGYERGQAEAMRDASCRAYNEIAKYLERQNVPRAKEKADYICQIVKGFMADEVMGGEE